MLTRIAWVLGLLSLAAWCGGCRCASRSYDEVFLLNATSGAPLISTDAGDPGAVAASFADASTADGSTADASAADWLDCTPAAAGCSAGQPCAPACHCVLERDLGNDRSTITKCTLLSSATPAVEVGYTITFSGCGD